MENTKRYQSLKEFYPFYLSQHSHSLNRWLHCIGTIIALCTVCYITINQKWSYLIALPVLMYWLPWIGHFFVEKNKPATFKYPIYSFISDFIMCFQMLSGKIKN